jgi:hypothetical protein
VGVGVGVRDQHIPQQRQMLSSRWNNVEFHQGALERMWKFCEAYAVITLHVSKVTRTFHDCGLARDLENGVRSAGCNVAWFPETPLRSQC